MRIHRKPKTAKWDYGSVVMVDDVTIINKVWTDFREIEFDATKDKRRGRHTTMRISLSESDVEALYGGLIKGRQLENRKLKAKLAKSEKRLTTEQKQRDKILSSKTLTEKWLVDRLDRALVEIRDPGWFQSEEPRRTYDSTKKYLDECFQGWKVRHPYRWGISRGLRPRWMRLKR